MKGKKRNILRKAKTKVAGAGSIVRNRFGKRKHQKNQQRQATQMVQKEPPEQHVERQDLKTRTEQRKKKDRLDDLMERAIADYNSVYTELNDFGIKLLSQRERVLDLLGHVENLIRTIDERPIEFDEDLVEIRIKKQEFCDACDFAIEELAAARRIAERVESREKGGGMAIASLAPSVAMWIATTFGTTSTEAAISALSGAAASNAALAWMGGGIATLGGGGIVAGEALLAMAGPVGWGFAGATLLTTIVLFSRNKKKKEQEKKEEIEIVLNQTKRLKKTSAELESLLKETRQRRERLSEHFTTAMTCYGVDYYELDDGSRSLLGEIMDDANALAASLQKQIR